MNQKVIDMLNQGRQRELIAVATYLTQHYELDDQMYGKLAERMKAIGKQEMLHAEAFAERVLFLGGVPSTRPEMKFAQGQSIREIAKMGEQLEEEAVRMYNDFAGQCSAEGDHVSKELFEKLAGEEEAHLDEFQNIGAFVDNLGAPYLATLTELK